MPTFVRNGFETHFERRGDGEPLLLIGGLGASTLQWQALIPFFEKHFQVIVYDNRGAGRSSAPDEPYSTGQMAKDALCLLDHLSVQRANVIGWSMGGLIAQILACRQPGRVNQLGLLHSFLVPDASLRNAFRNWINMRRSNMSEEQIVRHMAWLVFSRSFAADEVAYEQSIQFMVNSPHRQSTPAFIRQAEALLAHEPPPGLAELPIPVSILAGEEDRLVPRHHADQLHAAIPHSRLVVLPGGHVGAAEYPAIYASEVMRMFGHAKGRPQAPTERGQSVA